MNDSLKRREFIKTISLSGVSIALVNPITANSLLDGNITSDLKNNYFTIEFDKSGGLFSILRNNGSILLKGATSAVNSNNSKRQIASQLYKQRSESVKFTDQTGAGQMLKIYSKDIENKIDFEIHLSLYQTSPIVAIETICKNSSSGDIQVSSIEPLRAVSNETGYLLFPGVSKCITNGAIYYDAGMIHTFGTPFKKPEPYGETKGGKLTNGSLSPENETVHSWWNTGFFSGYDKESLVVGFIENNSGLGQILISKTGTNQFSFVAESVFAPGFILKPGQSVSSNRLMMLISNNPYSALENYASIVGSISKARTHSIINGWCSWFYTYDQISEEEVIRNAEFVSLHLKQFGLDYIQIDEGFQKFHGDWEGNDRFPHGMKWLADKIKSFGLKPGLWIAPYIVSEPTELFQKNPDWFIKNPDGSFKRVGPWTDEDTDWARNEKPKRYCLDITHPGAAQWLFNLIDMVSNQWGYEMIKIDFVAWSTLSAHHFYDVSATPAQVYRKGFEIMRAAAGEKCHLLDCGPGAVTAGLIDSMRIELDQNYGYSKDAWKQYFLESSSSAPAAAKRYYFHKRTWINDADHICVNLLSNSQSQAVSTLIALSGGNMISGDPLTELDITKLEILKKVLPSYGEAARPVDLFDSDLQSVFAMKIKKSFGQWTVAGFFNSSLTETIERKFSSERLWLDPDKTYLVYDFWKEKFIGEVSKELLVEILPGSVTLLSLHEKTGAPQVISTNRHVLQGAIELEDVKWDSVSGTLSGISTGPLNSAHSVTVYLPDVNPWRQVAKTGFRNSDAYNYRMVDDHILRIQVHFKDAILTEWKVSIK
jgi:hypothetical protein